MSRSLSECSDSLKPKSLSQFFLQNSQINQINPRNIRAQILLLGIWEQEEEEIPLVCDHTNKSKVINKTNQYIYMETTLTTDKIHIIKLRLFKLKTN